MADKIQELAIIAFNLLAAKNFAVGCIVDVNVDNELNANEIRELGTKITLKLLEETQKPARILIEQITSSKRNTLRIRYTLASQF